MNRILIIVGVVLVVLAGAALAAPSFIDWNQYRPQIAAQVERAVGHPVVIAGDVSFALLPQPSLTAKRVRIANAPGATGASLVALTSLDVRVAFAPLLRGAVEVRRVVLQEPVFDLEVLADGRTNWSVTTNRVGKQLTDLADALKVDSFVARNGTVIYRDPGRGLLVKLDNVNADLTANSINGPFAGNADFTVDGLPFHFGGATGTVDAAKPFSLRGDLVLNPNGEKASFRGNLSEATERGKLTGQLTVEAADFAAVLTRIARTSDKLPPVVRGLSAPLTATAQVAATLHEAGFNNLQVKLGDTTAAGAVNVALDQTHVDATLSINQLDLDAILAKGAREVRLTDTHGVGPPFVMPQFAGSLAVTIEALTYRSRLVRQVDIAATLAGGTATISRARALLPGISDVDATGTVVAINGAAQFDGAVKARSDNTRELMDWLGIGVAKVPPDRLRASLFDGRIRARTDLIQIYAAKLVFDTTTAEGAAAYAFRDRAAFSVDLDLDRLNVDAYRGLLPEKMALKSLDTFDTDIKLRAGELTIAGQVAGGVVAEVGLLKGALSVREVSVADVAGTHATITGIATGFADKVNVTGTINMVGESPAGVAALVGIDLGGAAATLGTITVNANVDGDQDKLRIDAGGAVAATEVRVRGTIAALADAPKLDLALDAMNPNAAELLRKLGLGVGNTAAAPMSVRATVAGPANELKVAVSAQVAGADLQGIGTASLKDDHPFHVDLVANHGNAAQFLRALGLTAAAPTDLGAAALRATLAGTSKRVEIGPVLASLGATTVQATGTLERGDARPHLTAKVTAGNVVGDTIWPATPGSPDQWSNAALPFAVAKLADLDVDFAAESLTARGVALTAPRATIHAVNGKLIAVPLSAGILGGTVDGTVTVTAADLPAVAVDLTFDRIDLAKAPPLPWAIVPEKGTLAAHIAFDARGRSVAELVGTLSGTATVNVQGGVLRGIDVVAVSKAVPALKEAGDLNDLLQQATSGGTTKLAKLEIAAHATAGTVQIDKLSAELDGAKVEATGTVDLPARRALVTLAVGLTEVADAPPFTLEVSGPWSQPRRQVRSRELQAFVAKSVVARATVVAPNEPRPAGAATPPPPAAPEVPLVEQLRQLLQAPAPAR